MLHTIKRWLGTGPAVDQQRWVVLDVESSGLDPHHDRTFAVGHKDAS